MAITSNCSKFLFYCKKLGVSFKTPLTLGRLHLYADRKSIESQIAFFNNNEKSISEVNFTDVYCEPLLNILGAQTIESLDYSDYEKPTIVHDLNQPIPETLCKRFSVVIDGGTIEHVFNFPAAIKNCMEMIELNGHYIGITPANNQMGHGFYQFSPELYYNVFHKENGFEMIKVIICALNENGVYSDWYEVANPKTAKSRIMLTNQLPTFLMVVAKKILTTEIFKQTPQQSDYQVLWQIRKSIENNETVPGEGKAKYLYRKFMPKPFKIFIRNVYDLFTKEKQAVAGLGMIDASQFKKIEI
jgi:hypothetical protein